MNDTYIRVENLRKTYGDIVAVNDVSFSIAQGEVFGLLGPNGAGKTTTLEIMEGLRRADSGTIHIAGLELPRQLDQLKQIIGVQLQATSLYDRITVGEALSLFAGYYRKARSVEELLQLVSLEEKRGAFVKNLSGGQLQRLALALALVNDPELVFLDEPTTGLDPQARQNVWAIIEKMKTEGRTVILTTHYMEEAERLADRVAVIDRGQIIAMDTPPVLIRMLGTRGKIECSVDNNLPLDEVEAIPGVTEVKTADGQLSFNVDEVKPALTALLSIAEQHGVTLEDIHVSRPNLEDVFLHLTGHRLRE